MACNIQILQWAEAQTLADPIRRSVFIQEQSVPEDMEWDGLDDDAIHALALDPTGLAIGYARLLPTKQLGRMAVLSDYRKTGVGRELLQALEDVALARHDDHLFLHAQIQALPFYEKQGYRCQGEPFEEAGIAHLVMMMTLTDDN